jgi:phage terminase small subunit
MAKRSYDEADKILALKVYELCDNNIRAAARELNMRESTLRGWIKKEQKTGNCADVRESEETLTDKQERFVAARLSGLNQTESARAAGYEGSDKVLAVIASQNLRKLKIQERIRQRLLSAANLSEDEIIGTLTEQMRGDMDDLLSENGFVSLDKARENGVTHLIKKLKYGEFGLSEVEFHNPQAAAVQLSKILGIEQQPRENDADKRKRLTVKMLKNLMAHGASKEQAKADLLKLAVTEEDVNSALAQIEAHEP